MFHTPRTAFRIRVIGLPDPAASLRTRCLDSAALWVMKRRANRPWLAPQRLPMAARPG